MITAIIFDTETADREKNNEVPPLVEAAWLAMADNPTDNLDVVSTYEERFNPGCPISFGAMATHHILDEEVADCRPAPEFQLPLGLKFLIGHNVDFDWNVIGKPNVQRICTLALSRYVWPDLDSHTQSALFYALHSDKTRPKARDTLRNAHSALTDVYICRTILRGILHELGLRGERPVTWSELWAVSEKARVPTVMPFGKHYKTPIKELPPDYKQWLLKQKDLDPYLKKALMGGVMA